MKALQIRSGNIIKYEGQLCMVKEMNHVTPGKGQAHVQVKMTNIETGYNVEARFRPNEDVEEIRLDEKVMEYLYREGNLYYFMDTQTYEQIPISEEKLSEKKNYLIPNVVFTIQFYEGKAVGIILPQSIDLKVKETEPYVKGATVSGSMKPAVLETGVTIQVPQFVEVGDIVKVKPSEDKYLERVKK